MPNSGQAIAFITPGALHRRLPAGRAEYMVAVFHLSGSRLRKSRSHKVRKPVSRRERPLPELPVSSTDARRAGPPHAPGGEDPQGSSPAARITDAVRS